MEHVQITFIPGKEIYSETTKSSLARLFSDAPM